MGWSYFADSLIYIYIFLLILIVFCYGVKWKSFSCVRLFATPVDYTVHWILQARILEWVAIPFFRGSSPNRDWTQVSHIAGGFFTSWATREAHFVMERMWKSVLDHRMTDSYICTCWVVRIGKRSPKWRWLKDKEGKSPRKQNRGRSKEGQRTGVRTSGRTALLAKSNLHRAGPGGRKYI